jgi:hypothetical protein
VLTVPQVNQVTAVLVFNHQLTEPQYTEQVVVAVVLFQLVVPLVLVVLVVGVTATPTSALQMVLLAQQTLVEVVVRTTRQVRLVVLEL